MKISAHKILRALILVSLICTVAICLPATAEDVDILIKDLQERFIDKSYWSSEQYLNLDMDGKALPSDTDIPQEKALETAIRALLNLKWETPSTISDIPDMSFSLNEHIDGRDWVMLIGSDKAGVEPPYFVKINAITGTIRYIQVNDTSRVPLTAYEMNPALDHVVSMWENIIPAEKTDASDSKSTPASDDLPLSKALNVAFNAVMNIKGISAEDLEEYTPHVEFHDYPYYGRFWEITIKKNIYEEGNTPLKVVVSSSDAKIIEISDPSQG